MHYLSKIVAWWSQILLPIRIAIIVAFLSILVSTVYLTTVKRNQISEINVPVTPPIPTATIQINTGQVLFEASNITITMNSNTINSFSTLPSSSNFYSATSINGNSVTLEGNASSNNISTNIYIEFETITQNSQRLWRIIQIKTYDPFNGWVYWNSGSPELFNSYYLANLYIPSAYIDTTHNGNYYKINIDNLVLQVFSDQFLPSPPPTADPSSSISCTPALFKQPFNIWQFGNSSPNSQDYFRPEYEVNYWDASASVGDVFAHGIKITNNSNKYLSTLPSVGFFMHASPINLYSDFQFKIHNAPYCTSQYNNYGTLTNISCPTEPLSLYPGETKVLAMPFFLTRIDDNNPSIVNTGYSFKFQNVSCSGETMNRYMPSPSPSPSIIPICHYQTSSVTITPKNQNVSPGQTVTYTASITNNDTQPCGSSTFSFSTHIPNELSSYIPQSSLWIPANSTGQITFDVTSPTTNPWNETRSVPISLIANNTTSNLSSTATSALTLLAPQPQTLNFRLKLAGVTDNKAEGSKVNVKFYLVDGSIRTLSEPLILTHVSGGIYKTAAIINNPLPPNSAFSVLVKGEKHIAVRYCKFTGQTTRCDFNQTMAYGPTSSDVYFDFTGLPLPAGDLPPQDGKVDHIDINLIKALMGKTQSNLTTTDLSTGDLNYDGFINMYDTFLILKTMEIRYDE